MDVQPPTGGLARHAAEFSFARFALLFPVFALPCVIGTTLYVQKLRAERHAAVDTPPPAQVHLHVVAAPREPVKNAAVTPARPEAAPPRTLAAELLRTAAVSEPEVFSERVIAIGAV